MADEMFTERRRTECKALCTQIEKIDKKILGKEYFALLVMIILGAYAYVAISNAGITDSIKTVNSLQDQNTFRAIQKIDGIESKLDQMYLSLEEHKRDTDIRRMRNK